ncbi:MAG: tRNA (5-methylaminomethyl-2-thiouridine)(34)-methyltransferase MnmD, partial [Flavobacteriales bacterium]|nr:tRNA (5-methylaminomethyl-2-thiouridine)(34)-methyltransferase MnmD [Flavobacteriales bacterium]
MVTKLTTIKTGDGSVSLWNSELDETYHSRHGAIQESEYVFIEQGFDQMRADTLNLLEVGFGTGLNALLTLRESRKKGVFCRYTSLETFPLPRTIYSQLGYGEEVNNVSAQDLLDLHEADWEGIVPISDKFDLQKIRVSLQEFDSEAEFDLIYYDAFGPRAQPEMWEKELFQKMYNALKTNGVLVTYCAKGQVRRDMAECGFQVERLPGPPGKRHMVR